MNERIHDVGERLQVLPENGELDFLFECGQTACESVMRMPATDYQRVRADNDRFVVVPGHEDAKIERVVERHERFFVVDKRPEAEPFVGADGEAASGA